LEHWNCDSLIIMLIVVKTTVCGLILPIKSTIHERIYLSNALQHHGNDGGGESHESGAHHKFQSGRTETVLDVILSLGNGGGQDVHVDTAREWIVVAIGNGRRVGCHVDSLGVFDFGRKESGTVLEIVAQGAEANVIATAQYRLDHHVKVVTVGGQVTRTEGLSVFKDNVRKEALGTTVFIRSSDFDFHRSALGAEVAHLDGRFGIGEDGIELLHSEASLVE
jgi:hypothetical protein